MANLYRIIGFVACILVGMIAFHVGEVKAQSSTGSVCVLAYEDVNHNGTRDSGEALLRDVSVSLMVSDKNNGNVVIANHITDGKEPYCFDYLPTQQYTVSFSSPLYKPTTSTSFTFSLAAGESATREFGATRDAATEQAPLGSGLNMKTDRTARIELSAAGAAVAMLFVSAIGLIFYGLFVHRGK